MNLSKRDRRALLIGVGALGVILVAHFVVLPCVDDWAASRDAAEVARAQLDTLERDVRSLLGQRQRLDRTFGPGANKPLSDLETTRHNLLKATQEVLKKAGVAATDYQPQQARQVRQVANVDLVSLQVRGKCKLPQLAKCLAGLLEAETLIFVDRLTVTNNEKKPGELEVMLVLASLAERGRAGS